LEGIKLSPLNPAWADWLMGWPVDWTDSKPLATDKFRAWCNSHGIPCDVAEDENNVSTTPVRIIKKPQF
jgi:hypothetical protein